MPMRRGDSSLSLPALEEANKLYGHFHAHLIHDDALYDEINRAIERSASKQVDLLAASSISSSNPFATHFLDLFDAEFTRVTDYIASQKESQEFSAKALMTNAEVFLANKDASNGSAVDTAKALRFKVSHQIDSCIMFERFVKRNAEILSTIASYADSKLNTFCSMMLQRKLMVSPWKDGPSSSLIVLLSDIYETIRAIEAEVKKKDAKWEAPSSFERATSKYWVKEDRLTELLVTAVQEVPLLVYGKKGNLTSKTELLSRRSDGDKLWDELATSISSVYFDSPSMDLYRERIARSEGAQLLRARWYGSRPSGDEPVFLELKTHHEKWINTKSVKERVTIREKDMMAFLSRKNWTPKDAEKIVLVATPSLSGTQLEQATDLLLRMHELVVKFDLQPCVRSTYLRVAFQSSNSNALRLTLDRNVTLIDERITPPGSWCLSDDAVISTSMIAKVPFSVFEVKLAGTEMPNSMLDLIAGGVIVEAAKFSKFLTGAAAFCQDRVQTLPYWADHPSFASVFRGHTTTIDEDSSQSTLIRSSFDSSEAVLIDFKASRIETPSMSKPETTEKNVSKDHQPKENSEKRHFPWLPFFMRRSQSTTALAPQRPARVEPKSYFANERTFIQWISASLLLVTVAVIVLEFPDQYAQAVPTGLFLIACAAVVMLYSVFVYFRRLQLLSSGKPYGYVDRVGPLLLGAAVLLGVVVLFLHFGGKTKSGSSMVMTTSSQECFQHNLNMSALEFQPSDLTVDTKRDLLLIPSVSKITAIDRQFPDGAKVVARLPGADLEAITFAGERVFAVAEDKGSSQLIELEWKRNQLEIVQQWTILSSMVEGIAFVPNGSGNGGRLFVASDNFNSRNDLPENRGQIHVYDLPNSTSSSLLSPLERLNGNIMTDGLADSKIGSLVYFEGLLFVLHDNAGLVRAWDLSTGSLEGEWKLPHVLPLKKSTKQWEGMFLERVADGEVRTTQLRGTGGGEGEASSLLLHLALDSPAQVWTLAVSRDAKQPGMFHLPSCAI